ncbi:MAG: molybdopterin-dependent oxidoreductase, partial [Fidelibacterota bacterium]
MSEKKVLTRREFLKLTGMATGGVAVAAGAFNQLFALSDKTIQALRKGPGKVTLRNTVCRLCPGGCSLQVRRIDGLPVSISGNTLSPINLGGTCPAAYANLEILYHPDRITTPMARPEGPVRKDLEPVEWDEIESAIAATINDLIAKKQTYKIAIINGDDSPLMQEVWQNFANWLGTPNFFQENQIPANTNSTFLTQGVSLHPKYDLINSDCIISLGANFLEEEGAPVHMNQVLSQFKDLKNITRNKLIYVGPRANITAASAHKWIPINADTWGTLALSIAHIIIDEHAVDLDYFRKNAHGFSNFIDSNGDEQAGFETMVRSEFHPKRIEEVIGISEEDIRDLAELLRSRKNPVILCGQEALQSPRGDLHLWATHCLNYLLGSIQRPGGWYFTKRDNETKLFSQKYTGGATQDLFFTDKIYPLEKKSLDIFAERVEG